MVMKYQVRMTVDESGAKYPGDGVLYTETDDLEFAVYAAEERTKESLCGYVLRVEDSAVLTVTGDWVDTDGQVIG